MESVGFFSETCHLTKTEDERNRTNYVMLRIWSETSLFFLESVQVPIPAYMKRKIICKKGIISRQRFFGILKRNLVFLLAAAAAATAAAASR